MFCPNCGAENADKNKFCYKCGEKLPSSQPASVANKWKPASPYPKPAQPSDPLTTPATIGGLAGMAGGALTAIGWFMPWSSIGLGSGMQIALAAFAGGGLLGALAELGDSDAGAIMFLCLGLGVAAILALIPMSGASCVWLGVRVFETRSTGGRWEASDLRLRLQTLRSRGLTIIGLMSLIFVMVNVIPFGGAILGRWFFLTAAGGVVVFVGAMFANRQLPVTPVRPQRMEPAWQRLADQKLQLTKTEQEVLRLVSQDLSDKAIAEWLGMRPADVGMSVGGLLQKFGVENKTDLVRLARQHGYLAAA
jgi:DNA-binding CsgD family transcriptional regulator